MACATQQALHLPRPVFFLYLDQGLNSRRWRALHSACNMPVRVWCGFQSAFRQQELTTIPDAPRHFGLSQPAVTSAIAHLQKLGIVRETTGRPREKVFVYGAFLDLLSEGTGTLPR